MGQDNQGSDLSDLKARLGLSKSDSGGQQADQDAQPEDASSETADRAEPSRAEQPPPSSAGAPPTGDAGPSVAAAPGTGDRPSHDASPTADSSGPGGPGPGADGPPGDAGRARSRPAQPSPRSGGPPPGARSGPPPGAGGSTASSSGTSTTTDSGGDLGPKPSGDSGGSADLDDDFDIDGGATFSGPVISLMGIILIVGVLFGAIGSTSYQNRRVYKARTADAKRVLDQLEPKSQTFEELNTIVKGLDPNKVNYDAAKKLADMDISLSSSALGGTRLLLGAERTSMLTSYLVDAERLMSLLKEHNRLTNKVEKKKLKEITGADEKKGEGKADEPREMYGVIFDFRHLIRHGGEENYTPKTGKLVKLRGLEDRKAEEKVEFRFLNSERRRKAAVQGVVPLEEGDVLTSGGENALQRYQQRVQRLKFHVKKLSGRPKVLVRQIKELADRPPAPLISLN